ncbi:MAG TPA: hypothetical protein VN650_17415 [Gemmatimonadaceae bacterium]|nr:hypothetical protein [Gemmatimonadaceae bacterium]
MLNQEELAGLERTLRDTSVLSAYIDVGVADPAMKGEWRVALDDSLGAIRRTIAESSSDEMAEFAKCASMLDRQLGELAPDATPPGWIIFVSPDGVQHFEAALAPTPTTAIWGKGPALAPYIHLMKERHPVIIAVMDARNATIYRYRLRTLERVDSLDADHVITTPLESGGVRRTDIHPRTRGERNHDAASRARLRETRRMLARLSERIRGLAGDDGWVVLGGIPKITAQAANGLSPISQRVLRMESLDVHSTRAMIADAARVGASMLRDASASRSIPDIIEKAEARSLGVAGPEMTRQALDLSCVSSVYMSPLFLKTQGAAAESIIRSALDQGANVQEVSRNAGALDEAGGIVARLRFRPSGGLFGLPHVDLPTRSLEEHAISQ